jgi:hypothetical protein
MFIMKKLLLTFSAVLFTASVFAGNLLVKEYGVNGTYSTIQDAINAAQDGDTIIVFNKPSGQYWLENLVISKEVFLENSDANQRFNQLDGNIEIQPQGGKKMFFLGIDLMSGHRIYSSNSVADSLVRCEINIMDCSMGEAEFADNNLHMRILDSDITTVTFRYGIMAGNNGTYLTISDDGGNSNDSIVIVGNVGYGATISTSHPLRILNNYFISHNTGSGSSNNSTCGCNNNCNNPGYEGAAALLINSASGSHKNIIANNTFFLKESVSSQGNVFTGYCNGNRHNTMYTYDYGVGIKVNYNAEFEIYNNVFDGDGSSYAPHKSIISNGGSGTPFVSHNYVESGIDNIAIPTNNEYNAQGVSLSIDGNGKASGAPVDGGIYLGQYNDIDLTRNDAGTYGGPYSIDNYHGIMANPSGGKASVHFIEIPHFLTQPGAIELKGGSHTKE